MLPEGRWTVTVGLLAVILYIAYIVVKPILKAVYLAIFCPIFSTKSFEVVDQPYPTDKEKDDVLNKGFKPERVPQNLDVIVIGSGPSGLNAAYLLAKAGKKVLVLEQHDTAGGSMHTFIEHGYEFDSGHHISVNVGKDGIAGLCLNVLLDGKVEFVSTKKYRDEIVVGSPRNPKDGVRRYLFEAETVDQWKHSMLKYFPGEGEFFSRLVSDVKRSVPTFLPFVIVKLLPKWLALLLIKLRFFDIFTNYPKHNSISTTEMFQKVSKKHPDLPFVLNPYALDLNVAADEFPYSLWTLSQKIFCEGPYYPIGGTSKMAYYAAKNVKDAGGEILVRAKVVKIITQGQRAIGVTVQKGSTTTDVFAPIIISSAGIEITFKHLLPRAISDSSEWYREAKPFMNKPTAYYQLFVGLNKTAEELDLPWQPVRCFTTTKECGEVFNDYLSLSLEEALEVDIPVFALFFNSAKDPTFNDRHPGKSTLEIFTIANNDWFNKWQPLPIKKRGDEYDELKKAFGQKMLDQALEICPQLKDHVDCIVYGTSASANYYFNRIAGGGTKLDNTRARMSLEASAKMRTDTGIPGLYLTGEDTLSISVDFSSTSGAITASEILGRNLILEALFWRAIGNVKSSLFGSKNKND